MAKNNLDEESEDNQAPDEAADTAFSSPDKETGDEEDALKAANDQRTAEEIAQAQALEKPDDATPAPTAPAADLIDADDDKTEAAKPSDDDKKDVAAEDEAAEDAIVEDDDKENAPKVDPNMIAAYNAVKDDKNMSPLQKKQMMMETYQQLLAQQRKGLAQAALLQGGSKIAQGMAMKYGANPGDNAEGVKTMQDMANLPVQQYLQNQLNQYRVQRAGLADAQANLATQKAAQVQSANSALNPALVKLMQLNWIKANPKADPSDMPDFASMTPNDLKQMSIGKPMGTSLLNTQPVRGLMNKETGNPVVMNKITQQLEDAVTHEPIKSGNVIRGIPTKDAFGNLIYAGAPGTNSIKVNNAKTATTPIDTAAQGETPGAKLTLFQIRDQNPDAAKAIEHEQSAMYSKDSLIKKLRDAGYREDLFNAKLTPIGKNPDGTLIVDSGMAPGIRAQMSALAVGGIPGEHTMDEFGGAGGADEKVKRLLLGAFAGKVTQADLDFYNRYSQKMHNTIQNAVQKAAQIHIDNTMSQFPMTREQAIDLLGVNDIVPAGQAAQEILPFGKKRYLVDHVSGKVIREVPSGQ